MKNKYVDERIVQERNKIFKICFLILCAGILIDIMIKINLIGYEPVHDGYYYNKTDVFMPSNKNMFYYLFYVSLIIESIFLSATFLSYVYLQASKGILCGCDDDNLSHFPIKRYTIISLIVALPIGLGSFIIRICGYISSGGLANSAYAVVDCIIVFVLFLVVCAVSLCILLLIFFSAYLIAKRKQQAVSEGSESRQDEQGMLDE